MVQKSTIWIVRMPNEPPSKNVPTPAMIRAFLRANRLVANDPKELEKDLGFALNVMGQTHFLGDVAAFFAPYADQFHVQVLFLPWEEAFWHLKRCHGEYVIRRGDVVIMEVPSSWCAHFAAEGMLRDLSSCVDPNHFSAKTLDWYRWNDGIYAVPSAIDVRLVFYNKQMLRPKDFHSQASFLKACRRVMSMSDHPDAVLGIPTQTGFDTFHVLMIWMWNMGLPEVRPEAGGLLFGSADIMQESHPVWKAVDLLVKMRVQSFVNAPQDGTRDIVEEFLAGRYAMVIHGPWVLKLARERQAEAGNTLNLGIALPPDFGAGGRYTFEGGGGLGICAERHADPAAVALAEKFLLASASPESQLDYSQVTGYLPASLEAQQTSPFYQEIQHLSGWTPENSRIYPRSPEWAPYGEHMTAVDTLEIFWRVLQDIDPHKKKDAILSAQRLLVNHLAAMNRRIDQINKLAHERFEREKADLAARERSTTVQHFARMIVHLLGPVHGKIRNELSKASQQTNTARLPEYIQKVLDKANRAHELLETFDDFAKLGRFECNDILAGHNLVEKLAQEVQATLPEATLSSMGTSQGISLPRVAVNLVSLIEDYAEFARNSLHHRKSDIPMKITLTGETISAGTGFLLSIGLDDRRSYVKIIYSDNGTGVAQEKKEQIFEPLFTTRSPGTGLGLAIIRMHADTHGGLVRECGIYGEGAQFELYLPALSDTPAVKGEYE